MSKLLYPQAAGAAIANRAFRTLFGLAKRNGREALSEKTLVKLLARRAAQQGEKTAFSFVRDGGAGHDDLSFAQLDAQARAIAAALEEVAAKGDRALLLYPPGLEFISSYVGCLYAGVAAVPAYPPHPARPEKALSKLQAIVETARPAAVLTTAAMKPTLESLFERSRRNSGAAMGGRRAERACSLVATDEVSAAPDGAPRGFEADENDLAMIQFTSGSTGTPRGVMVTHGNLMHNLGLIRGAFGADRRSRGVFWLPFYHDMGLIGGVLETVYCGGSSTFLSPLAFLQQPLRWLEAISRTRATISGGPNFAYEECIRRIDDEQLDSLDLSHWRVAFCGAEPIHRQTMEQFAKKFARCGFRRDALYCTYGMAEATLMISGGRFASSSPRQPRWSFSADCGGRLDSRNAPVSCGKPVGDVQAKIVDPDTGRICKEGDVGEIWVATASRGQGYWRRPDESRETFQARLCDGSGPFLRTGDLGFLRDGELYVSGRLKDMIIIGGVNHYPQDLEQTVAECHQLLGGGVAAFAVPTERREGLAIVAEVSRQFYRNSAQESQSGGRKLFAKEIKAAIRQAIAQRHEVTVDAIVLVSPRTIPRTSSGKIQRRACRQAYLEASLSLVEQ